MKKLYLFALLFIVVLAGCTESKVEKVDAKPKGTETAVAGKTTEPTAAPTASPAPKKEAFVIGDTVKFDDLEITLNGVKVTKGSEFQKPKESKYLLIDLTIENKGSKAAAISTVMGMSLNDADSFKHNITMYLDAKGTLDGELAAGRKVRGEVAFDVPDSAYYEFVYSDPFTTGQAIWKFEAK